MERQHFLLKLPQFLIGLALGGFQRIFESIIHCCNLGFHLRNALSSRERVFYFFTRSKLHEWRHVVMSFPVARPPCIPEQRPVIRSFNLVGIGLILRTLRLSRSVAGLLHCEISIL